MPLRAALGTLERFYHVRTLERRTDAVKVADEECITVHSRA
jgi:hypothetical protein